MIFIYACPRIFSRKFREPSDECLNLLKLAVAKMQLLARSYQRIIKLSRTIADLENAKEIQPQHVAEALQYRPKMEMPIDSL
jgi:magnesium chelatase family protein